MALALYSTAQQQLKHWCFNIAFLLQPKHSIIPGTMKEKSTSSQLKLGHQDREKGALQSASAYIAALK